MIRKFKLVGVMALAALALTAVAASAAQAAPEFHVESAPATITGEQIGTQKFTTEKAGTVECSTATFHGSTSVTTTTTQTLTANYGGCKAFFSFVSATVNMNECDYLFHLTPGGISPYPATVDVVCPTGKSITISSAFTSCVVTVGSQTGLEGVSITNTGTKTTRDIDVTLAVKGVKYTTTSGCSGGAGTWTDAELHGSATVKADVGSTATQQGLWVA
jgi:hypothetical protein